MNNIVGWRWAEPQAAPGYIRQLSPTPTHHQNVSSLSLSLFLSLWPSLSWISYLHRGSRFSYYDDPAVFLPLGPHHQCDNDRTAWGATEYHHHHPHHDIWSIMAGHRLSCPVVCFVWRHHHHNVHLYLFINKEECWGGNWCEPRLTPIRHFKII